jgi:hypothetical protein
MCQYFTGNLHESRSLLFTKWYLHYQVTRTRYVSRMEEIRKVGKQYIEDPLVCHGLEARMFRLTCHKLDDWILAMLATIQSRTSCLLACCIKP